MRRRALILLAIVALAGALPATTVAASPRSEPLNMYTVKGSAESFGAATAGIELVKASHTANGTRAQAVLTKGQAAKLRAQGLDVKLVRNKKGQTVREQARIQALNGFTVWKSWDEAGGIRDQLYDIARRNPQLVKLVVLGHTYQGREIIALKLTQGARDVPDGSRPAVLYSSLQHAREWISGEVNLRTLRYFISKWRANDKAIKSMLKTRELWFLVVSNPDGYQYTFDHERLWRKNLRDNNGDHQVTVADGVDPNRNFDEHWGYDDEGSSPVPGSDTYRGPSAASEPETQAMQGLIDLIKPKFMSNLHSVGEWLLYPQGWQTGTLDADIPVYVAMAGTDANPAIEGFDPGQSADTLYVTNGETTDYADTNAGTIAITPELGDGDSGGGFVFPDDEALVQAEFQKALPFHLAMARSATDADDPVSPVGITTQPFYLNLADLDPQHNAQTLFDFKFDVSYGNPQEARILAKRSLGAVSLKYRVNGGSVQTKTTGQWNGGEKYGPGNGALYHVMSGQITGTAPGDSVEVWFTGGGATSASFTYKVESDTDRRVLVVAAEDYTGASPVQTPGPHYLDFYTDALTASGVAHDVYDIDANGRKAPDSLGVLSHYRAVIWYTGDDTVTREPGWGPGNASRLAMQTLFEIRDFMNEGGRAVYTGRQAGQQFSASFGAFLYDPFENQQCRVGTTVLARCLQLSGSPQSDGQNDVIEYWLGAATTTPDGGFDPDSGEPLPIDGIDDPLDGLTLDRGGNQTTDASFVATTHLLSLFDPEGSFPQFDSWASAEYVAPVTGTYEPHSGAKLMWAGLADEGYKRLTRTISVPAGGGSLSFWSSYRLEQDFDYMIIEARPAGTDDWTTLPDSNGHTSSDLSADQACTNGWSSTLGPEPELHPFLQHYQTHNEDGSCSSVGSTGAWNALNGSSDGWTELEFDLSAYASSDVEVSITVLSDWGFQEFPGVVIDDVTLPGGSTSFEDDADPTDGWAPSGAPQDADGIEGANANDWTRRGGLGVLNAAAISTTDSVYLGFGFEGIDHPADRQATMDRLVDYLLR